MRFDPIPARYLPPGVTGWAAQEPGRLVSVTISQEVEGRLLSVRTTPGPAPNAVVTRVLAAFGDPEAPEITNHLSGLRARYFLSPRLGLAPAGRRN